MTHVNHHIMLTIVWQSTIHDADMGLMWDAHEYNSGFVITRPTQQSINIWKRARYIGANQQHTDDQTALNTGDHHF